jgi:hypothetical protein
MTPDTPTAAELLVAADVLRGHRMPTDQTRTLERVAKYLTQMARAATAYEPAYNPNERARLR